MPRGAGAGRGLPERFPPVRVEPEELYRIAAGHLVAHFLRRAFERLLEDLQRIGPVRLLVWKSEPQMRLSTFNWSRASTPTRSYWNPQSVCSSRYSLGGWESGSKPNRFSAQ